MAFRGVILSRVQSFLSPRTDSNFRHLSSCDTLETENFASECSPRVKVLYSKYIQSYGHNVKIDNYAKDGGPAVV